MKNIGEQIQINATNNIRTIRIAPKMSRLQETLFMTWLSAWTFCGLAVIFALISAKNKEEAIGYLIFLAFWGFFEFKITRVYLWKKKGGENLKIDQKSVFFKNTIRKNGFEHEFQFEHIKNFKTLENNKQSFLQSLDNSFWVIGGHRLEFEYHKKKIQFGVQLNDIDTRNLYRYIQDGIKHNTKKFK